MKEQILSLLEKHGPMNATQVSNKIGREAGKDFNDCMKILVGLEQEGKVAINKEGEFRLIPKEQLVEGTISIALKGFGFVKDENDIEYFVLARDVGTAMNGDKVAIRLVKNDRPKNAKRKGGAGDLANGKVVKVLERNKDFFVGEIVEINGTNLVVKTDNTRFTMPVAVDFEEELGLVEGSKIMCQVYEFGTIAKSKIIRVIGHKNDPGVDIMSIVHDLGIRYEFDEDVLEQAANAELNYDEKQKEFRRDIRHLNITTIDPATAKDLDDAIFVEKLEGGKYRLVVSIADVSYYVTENSPMDKEAYWRGTSTYLVDRVIPMLPHKLSNDLCSLNPNVDRYALTCDMIIDGKGKVVSQETYSSIINSKRRFSYDEVNDFFAGKTQFENDDPAIVKGLNESKELGDILMKAMERRGYIDFGLGEAKIIVNEQGVPTDIVKYVQGKAQKMIEVFMIAANETIARTFEDLDLPGIFRVHDRPKADKMEQFAIIARKLGVKLPESVENITNEDLQKILAKIKGEDAFEVIAFMLLRSMNKAIYTADNIGHYGLGSECYTHFTSPIRRYPDLIVHRLIYKYIVFADRSDNTQKHYSEWIPIAADQATNCEMKAVQCERAVNAMKMAEYCKQFIGKEFTGMITGVTRNGFFVQLENLIEGRVDIMDLTDDFYEHFDEQLALIGQKTRKAYRMGERVTIVIKDANKEERKIDFKIPGLKNTKPPRRDDRDPRKNRNKPKDSRDRNPNRK